MCLVGVAGEGEEEEEPVEMLTAEEEEEKQRLLNEVGPGGSLRPRPRMYWHSLAWTGSQVTAGQGRTLPVGIRMIQQTGNGEVRAKGRAPVSPPLTGSWVLSQGPLGAL